MKSQALPSLLKLSIVAAAASLTLQTHAESRDDSARDDADHAGSLRLATGQYITPLAVQGSNQQLLNPGLPLYPSFVAGEAVKSQLSPDGKTLAIICAGQNSLDNAAGTADAANSTQYIFLYDVSGAHKATPALSQVVKQTNAHVGLVFSPDGNALYATGGKDDVVYAYNRTGGNWSAAGTVALGHAGKGVGLRGDTTRYRAPLEIPRAAS